MITCSRLIRKNSQQVTESKLTKLPKTQVRKVLNQGNLVLSLLDSSPINGYGACSVSGCNCRAFEGSDYTCSNCGHNYDRHW